MIVKTIVKSAVSMLAISWAAGAFAQDAAPAADAGAADAVVDEIIVTAQRRAERLVDVPITVATATADDLERAGPSSIENLTKVTPGVYLQRASYGLSPTVRGIGSTLPASAGEQIVAMYVDEIYYPTPTGNVFDLASIAGVELLKGPQGTLFGRNATGGAILLRTLDPGFDVAGKFKVSLERFNQVRSSAYLNLPVTDKIAVNGSVAYRYSEGYVRDRLTGRHTNEGDSFTARGKILLQATDSFSIVLTGAHATFDDPTGTDFRSLQPSRLVAALGGPISTDPRVSSSAIRQVIKTETDELSARARLEMDAGTLSSFTAFLKNKLDATSDLTGSYLPSSVGLAVSTKTFTQEVNFASNPDQPLNYVVGLYYFRNRTRIPFVNQDGTPLFFSRSNDYSLAGYFDGSYKFGDLSLIGGIRYTYEKRKSLSGFGATDTTGTYSRDQSTADKQWTPRVGLRYALGARSNVYATYSKGFKSGKFDVSTPTGPGVIPETVDAFEVGLKSESRALSFNAAAFYYDYKNTQVNATISGSGGQIFTQLFNVPKSRIYGMEADASLRLNDNFDLRLAAAYTHARYRDFPNAPGYVDDPANPATNPGGVLFPGALYANVGLDVSGKNMVRAPEFTASSTISYHSYVGDNKELEIALSPYYSSRVYFTFDNSLSQKPYFTLDGTVKMTFNENMEVAIFGRNLTDVKYATGASQNALSLDNRLYAAPLTYGVSLGYSF